MSDLTFLSAGKLTALLRDHQVSPVELVEAHIRRIEQVDTRINAVVTKTFEAARSEARLAEERLARGTPCGPLDGLPVTIKDTIETAGVRTVSGTRLRESFVPSADAPVVTRLKRAGAIVLGKTNVPECAMDLRAENPVFGRTSNPWNLERVPGGSSGGEAAAIASGCSAGGVGSDMGGSIRVPAHFCGIAGLKPTPGRVPASGHFPPVSGPHTLGCCLGPMARRVEDLALLFGVLAGFDSADPMSVPFPSAPRPGNLRVMWYADNGIAPATAATRQAVARAAAALEDRGLDVVEHRPAGLEHAFEIWNEFLNLPALPGIVRYYEGREELMGPLLRGVKKILKPLSMERYMEVWRQRDLLRASVVAELMERPIILAPVAALPAFEHGHRGAFNVEGQTVEYLKAFSYATAYNVLGLPSLSLPYGMSPEGLPIGVQVVGRPFEDETVLEVAAMLEESWGEYRPPVLAS